MLNGDGNENGIKINRSNQQKNKLHMQHAFFLISKKKDSNFHVLHSFCLSLPLFCTATMLFCRTKSSNSLLHIIFMEELSYVLTQYFVPCVHIHFYFSLPLIFTLLTASIFHCLTAALNFHVFLPTKFVSFVFNHSPQPFLCYPRECKHQKQHRKRHDFVVVFSFLKSRRPCDFFASKTLSCISVAIPGD